MEQTLNRMLDLIRNTSAENKPALSKHLEAIKYILANDN